MQRVLALIVLTFVLNQGLIAQCNNGQLLIDVVGKIENDHRHNNAFTYGMVSYQSHEDNFYFEGRDQPAFYLGYGKSLWVGGRDTSGVLHVSANTFPTLNNHDFIPGPLDRATGQPIDTLCYIYNRVWIIKQVEVFQLQEKFQRGELTEADIPQNILEWPANGNPFLGDVAPDYDLAPFADINEDGIYDPLAGDYPVVLEENIAFVPHEFSFIVYNDMSRHTATFSQGMGFEFHQTNYLLNCNEDSEAEQSVFTRIKYLYLGQEPLTDVKVSLWEDNDLACNQNDYEGCDRELNCTYFYNQNGETFLEECHDPDVPDNNGAVRTTVFFNHEMKSFKHWFLLGVGDTLIPGIDPSGAQEYYNYMSGVWRFGEPTTVGGNGYESSTDTTLFSFPSRPHDPNGWSMQTAQQADTFLFAPLDVRALTTLIDQSVMLPGTTGVIDFADHFLYDKENKRLSVFDEIWPAKIESLKADFEAFKEGTFDCGGDLEICIEDCVWPGDVNLDAGVDAKDFITAGLMSTAIDSAGIPRSVISTDWFAFNADNWSDSYNGLNAKHADVNGNGEVNSIDLDGIASNFGETRTGYTTELVEVTRVDSLGLHAVFEEEVVDLETASLFQKIVETDLVLGDAFTNIEQPLHGLSFQMRFDTNLVRPFTKIDEIFSQIFDYEFAGMLNATRNAAGLVEGDDNIQYAFTNLGGRLVTRGGELANQNLRVRDDAATTNPDGIDTLVLRFYNICATDAEGNLYDMGVVTDSLIITNLRVDTNLVSSVKNIETTASLSLYPNPATDQLYVDFSEITTGQLLVYNVQGQLLMTQQVDNADSAQLNIAEMPIGLLVLKLETKDGESQAELFVKE